MEDYLKGVEEKMEKTLNVLKREFGKLRTGRASVALLDSIRVEYYGQKVPLNHVATLSVPESRLIVVQPWDPKLIPEIEKAISSSDLGLNPVNDGKQIKIPIPPLSEERRKELVKIAGRIAENSRIAIRNIRREANDHYKKMEKNKEISKDELKVYLDKVQKLTDKYIEKIDELLEEKEKEIME